MRYEAGILEVQPAEPDVSFSSCLRHECPQNPWPWRKLFKKKVEPQNAWAAARFGASIRAASFKQARTASQMHIQGSP